MREKRKETKCYNKSLILSAKPQHDFVRKWCLIFFAQQKELIEEGEVNRIKLQEAKDQFEKKKNKFAGLLRKIVPKLTEIQETIYFILNLSINVNSDILKLDHHHSYDVCREIKKKIKVALKEVI